MGILVCVKWKPPQLLNHTHTHTQPNSTPDSSFYLSNKGERLWNPPWGPCKWSKQLGSKWSSKWVSFPLCIDFIISETNIPNKYLHWFHYFWSPMDARENKELRQKPSPLLPSPFSLSCILVWGYDWYWTNF